MSGSGRLWLLPLLALAPFGIDFLTARPSAVRTVGLLGIAIAACGMARWILVRPNNPLDVVGEAGSRRIVLALAAGYLLVGGFLSLLQHRAFGEILGQDTAYFSQLLWSTSHGEGFRGQILNDLIYSPPIRSHFGAHNSPFLFLLAPLSRLLPGAPALLLARTLALAVTAVPAFAFLRRHLPGPSAVILTAALLVHPTLLAGSFHSLYELPFALPFLAGAIYFLDVRRPVPYALCLLAAVTVREDLALVAAMIGITALFRRGGVRWAAATIAASAVWFVGSYAWVMPHFGGESSGSVVTGLFARFGDSPVDILLGMLRDPVGVLQELLGARDRTYLLQLGRSTGLVWSLGLVSLAAAPALFFNLLLSDTKFGTTILFYHYSLVPALALLLGAGQGIGRLARRLAERAGGRERASAVLALSVLAASVAGSFDVLSPQTLRRLRPGSQAGALREAVARIPPRASASAPRGVLPHLAARSELFVLDEIARYRPEPRPDYVLIDTDLERARIFREHRETYLDYVARVLREPEYHLLMDRDGVRLYRREGVP